ncbi:MAG: Rrf2 family transcriptional regulator [Fimbriimonas ginsengisoli]|uniref:Rrf2 family transcriptional regulator n=1 Tax=Fimbriimonas ginsengisoli TaxID=1005039 RepID=A0A931LS12_FIMGI|nr:Rrf2 family transcriptional regulator [Fimbriimonas ginsengisoli]
MKFSAQEEYGLRCLLQIARRGPGASMTIPEISREEGLSATHVAKLLTILRKSGLIRSTRGQSGGYTLSRAAEALPLGEVLAILGGRLYDGDFCSRHAGQFSVCTHDVDCSVRSLWNTIQSAVDGALAGMTLADLLSGASFDRPARAFVADLRTVN